MPQGYFVQKPQVVFAIQWTGDNFQEVLEFVQEDGRPIADMGDGTLMTGYGQPQTYQEMPVELGGWVDAWGVPFNPDGMQPAPSSNAIYQFVTE